MAGVRRMWSTIVHGGMRATIASISAVAIDTIVRKDRAAWYTARDQGTAGPMLDGSSVQPGREHRGLAGRRSRRECRVITS